MTNQMMMWRSWSVCSAMALMSVAIGCGETAVVEGGNASGQGGYFNSDIQGAEVASTGIFADGIVTDAEYEQYVSNVEAHMAEEEFIPAPWSTTLTSEDTASVEVTPDTLTFPPEALDPSDPAYDAANPDAMAPAKYRTGAILVSANYAQDKVFLRRITGVTQGVNGTTYTTRDAAITEAVFKGTITQSPTELDPSFYQGNITTQQMLSHTFSIDDIRVGSGFEYGVGTSGENGSAGLIFEVTQPRIEGLSVPIDLNADIDVDWLGTIFGGLFEGSERVTGGGMTTRTSCGTVTDGLNFARGNESDSQNCARALRQWEDSPNYPAIPSSVSDIDGVTVRNAGGADRIACKNEIRWRPDSTVLMPLPHEIAWAQGNCGGALKSFDLVTGFEPALAVDNISIRAEAQASASRDTERMCEGCEVSKSKTFFIGWFPVVVKLQGEVIGKGYDVSVEGRMEAGIRGVRLGLDLDLELHYDRENGPVSSRSSWNMIADVSPIVEGEWYAEAAARGHAEHQIAGLRTSLYFYDLAGPYFIPADLYGHAEAQLATQSAQVEGETCNLGLTAGFKTSAGLAGKVPLTNSEPVAWELFSYDSCGVDLAQNAEETRLSRSFLERESSLCIKKCLSVTPLNMALTWDQNQDIDLKVTDPEGRVIDRNWNTGDADVSFVNRQGCQRGAASTCFGEGGTGNREIITWTERDPPAGTYTVEVKSYAEQSVDFELLFKGDAPTGEPVVDDNRRGTISPDATREFTFTYSP